MAVLTIKFGRVRCFMFMVEEVSLINATALTILNISNLATVAAPTLLLTLILL